MLSHDPINMILAAAALGLPFELLRIRPSTEELFDFMIISSILQLIWQAGQANAAYLRDVLLLKLDSIIRLEQEQQTPELQNHTSDAVWATLKIFGILQLSRDAHDANATYLRDVIHDRSSSALYLSAETLNNKFRALGLANNIGRGQQKPH